MEIIVGSQNCVQSFSNYCIISDRPNNTFSKHASRDHVVAEVDEQLPSIKTKCLDELSSMRGVIVR
jgi:hypothetical protein